jgi:hypothetical protein
LRANELRWYHSKEEVSKGSPLGIIFLENIYTILPSKDHTKKETFDFVIGAGCWRKKE